VELLGGAGGRVAGVHQIQCSGTRFSLRFGLEREEVMAKLMASSGWQHGGRRRARHNGLPLGLAELASLSNCRSEMSRGRARKGW
jgi:hypothetical protein